jgi:orotate phosphoribosyltransferase
MVNRTDRGASTTEVRDLESSERMSLARDLVLCCRLSGSFKLRSGQTSSVYFDKYQFETSPSLLKRVVQQMVPLIPQGTEVLAGLELGGVPIATALSLETGIPAAFIRKSAKQYGTCRLVEGVAVEGKRICVVEDVITTGGQVLISANELRNQGALVTSLLCVIWRAAGQPSLPEIETCRALFTAAELEPPVPNGGGQ